MTVYALFDTHYLCHRARHTTGQLSYQNNRTGVAFGVLKEIDKQRELYQPDVCVFAFDYGGTGNRGQIYPDYKKSRRERVLTDEEKIEQEVFFEQVKGLYSTILPAMGFRNIFKTKGFEGDDIIARIALSIGADDEAIIISGDEDLWQVLSENVTWVAPRGGVVTAKSFREKWGVQPFEWAAVKALAGCSTDDVAGIKGVGPSTAVKWIKGQLKPESKKYKDILENLSIASVNTPLVTLPFQGTPEYAIRPDEFTEKKRRDVLSSLGIRVENPSRFTGFDL